MWTWTWINQGNCHIQSAMQLPHPIMIALFFTVVLKTLALALIFNVVFKTLEFLLVDQDDWVTQFLVFELRDNKIKQSCNSFTKILNSLYYWTFKPFVDYVSFIIFDTYISFNLWILAVSWSLIYYISFNCLSPNYDNLLKIFSNCFEIKNKILSRLRLR